MAPVLSAAARGALPSLRRSLSSVRLGCSLPMGDPAAAVVSPYGYFCRGPMGAPQCRSVATKSRTEVYHEGLLHTEFTTDLNISKESPVIPIFRILTPEGQLEEGWQNPFSKEETLDMYRFMVRLSIWDNMLYNVQRQGLLYLLLLLSLLLMWLLLLGNTRREEQPPGVLLLLLVLVAVLGAWGYWGGVCVYCIEGRFSFYIQNQGEEATQAGIGKALQPEDNIFCQYR